MSNLAWRITPEVLTALEASRQWERWSVTGIGPRTAGETFASFIGTEASSEQELLQLLGDDNHAGGLPQELVRKLARLAAPPTVESAKQMAIDSHAGQVDKAGKPYIGHPARVAARVAGDSLAEKVAWLHDVVEDTDITLADVEREFGSATAKAVDAITRRVDEDPTAYYSRVRANKTALKVKLADIADNFDSDRLSLLAAGQRDHLTAKYHQALEQLGQARYWARWHFKDGKPTTPYFLIRWEPGVRDPEWWSGRDAAWGMAGPAYDALWGRSSDSLNTEPISEADARARWPEAFQQQRRVKGIR